MMGSLGYKMQMFHNFVWLTDLNYHNQRWPTHNYYNPVITIIILKNSRDLFINIFMFSYIGLGLSTKISPVDNFHSLKLAFPEFKMAVKMVAKQDDNIHFIRNNVAHVAQNSGCVIHTCD